MFFMIFFISEYDFFLFLNEQSARASHIRTQCHLLFKLTALVYVFFCCVCVCGFFFIIHKKHKFSGAGNCGLAYAPARVAVWCAKAFFSCLLCMCVVFVLACLRFTCCTGPSWHLHVCLLDSGRSGIYTGKKMAAREVGGRGGFGGVGSGRVGVQLMHFYFLMIHYRWRMTKRSLMVKHGLSSFSPVVFLFYNLSSMKHWLPIYLYLYIYILLCFKTFFFSLSGPAIHQLSSFMTNGKSSGDTSTTLRSVQALHATFLVKNTHIQTLTHTVWISRKHF